MEISWSWQNATRIFSRILQSCLQTYNQYQSQAVKQYFKRNHKLYAFVWLLTHPSIGQPQCANINKQSQRKTIAQLNKYNIHPPIDLELIWSPLPDHAQPNNSKSSPQLEIYFSPCQANQRLPWYMWPPITTQILIFIFLYFILFLSPPQGQYDSLWLILT